MLESRRLYRDEVNVRLTQTANTEHILSHVCLIWKELLDACESHFWNCVYVILEDAVGIKMIVKSITTGWKDEQGARKHHSTSFPRQFHIHQKPLFLIDLLRSHRATQLSFLRSRAETVRQITSLIPILRVVVASSGHSLIQFLKLLCYSHGRIKIRRRKLNR